MSEVDGGPEDFIFHKPHFLDKAIDPRALNDMIKGLVSACKKDPKHASLFDYDDGLVSPSSHGVRKGALIDSCNDGWKLEDLLEQGGWETTDMVVHYAKHHLSLTTHISGSALKCKNGAAMAMAEDGIDIWDGAADRGAAKQRTPARALRHDGHVQKWQGNSTVAPFGAP
ncbi:hypothetical protein AURDEDRAFT_168814 [Auricularia subglabra TFB-10046 SS5]|nr:hypothetical protein AURDEDRAFT_168814 [Auricularia subglabra TFB-10046 SS5]